MGVPPASTTSPPLRLLIVEDSPRDAELLQRQLRQAGFALAADVVSTSRCFAEALRSKPYDIVLADYNLPGWSGLDALVTLQQSGKDIPLIFVTGTLGDEAAAECIRKGAADYILKDRPARLPSAIAKAAEEKNARDARRWAEQAHEHLEEQRDQLLARLQLQIDRMPAAYLVTDANLRFTGWNPAAEKVFGYTHEEALGKQPFDLIVPPHLHNFVDQILRKAIAEPEIHGSGIGENITKDGRNIVCEWRDMPLFDAEGSFEGLLSMAVDITERKRAEEDLRAAEEGLRALVDSLDDIVFELDAEGTCHNIWARDESLLARPKAELIGRRASEILGAGFMKPFLDAIQRVLESGRPEELEYSLEVGGAQHWFLARISPVRSAGGPPKTACLLIRETTERKRAQDELRWAKEAAEAADRAKSDFLANVSHELRTPLNGVMGMTELLFDTELTSEQREYLRIVSTSAETMLTLINNLLDLNRIEAHTIEVLRTEFRLREIVTMAFHSQAVCADRGNLELVCHIAPTVPDAVLGDPVRLRQVLASLLSNAVKFTKHGGVVLNVGKDCQAADRVTLHFSVRDTGIGIPPEKQQMIFQPFTQVDASSKREFGGAGLGLAITSRLVELMGGKIWLESELGQGSTFHFTAVLGLNGATNLKT